MCLVSSRIEIHLLLATFKNQSLLAFNLRGESHEKGLPEDAMTKASEGVLYLLESYFVLCVYKTINDLRGKEV